MFANIVRLAREKNARWGFILALLISIATLIVVLLFADLKSPAAPLHYNIYFGIDLAGPGMYALVPWAIATFSIFVNLFLALIFIEREIIATRLLAWFSFLFSLVVFCATMLVLWYQP